MNPRSRVLQPKPVAKATSAVPRLHYEPRRSGFVERNGSPKGNRQGTVSAVAQLKSMPGLRTSRAEVLIEQYQRSSPLQARGAGCCDTVRKFYSLNIQRLRNEPAELGFRFGRKSAPAVEDRLSPRFRLAELVL